jgi:5-methyltetrahydropteroyltriglutamate--homocysteine methyltransferase
MELVLANHSSYPRIGDSADHQLLRRTIAQRDKGEKTDQDVRAAEERLTELALEDQIAAGLDLLTDGQIRWYDPISHLAGKLAGVRINGLLRFFDTNFYFRQPVVKSRPRRIEPLLAGEFNFAKAKSSRPLKVVLTGPYTLARLSIEEDGRADGFEKLLDGYTAALGEEIASLAQAGATFIQVEEPAILRHPEDFPWVEQGLTALAMSLPARFDSAHPSIPLGGTRDPEQSRMGGPELVEGQAGRTQARLALAVYFGDPAPLYDRFQTLPVDVLVLDFTYNPELVEMVAAQGSSKGLGLGLVDGRNTRLEDPAGVARQIERIARGTGLSQAHLNPSCGLEYLPRDRAQLKLRQLTVIKNTFLGSRA